MKQFQSQIQELLTENTKLKDQVQSLYSNNIQLHQLNKKLIANLYGDDANVEPPAGQVQEPPAGQVQEPPAGQF